jgi:uncharacterized protein (DUF488 family)
LGELFTIGHSQYNIGYFIDLLKKYEIDYLLDVRSIPYSRYAEQFNKDNISRHLATAGINYTFSGRYFGARPQNIDLYNQEGHLDFEKVRQSSDFRKGIDNVFLGLSQDHRIALMCTEKDPIDCHRAILVARAFEMQLIYAKHILPDGRILTQQQLNEQLLHKYYPDRRQLSLFNYQKEMNEQEYLTKAYIKRNKEIGYYIGDSKKSLVV